MQIRVGLYGAAINLLLLAVGAASGILEKSELVPGLPFVLLLFLVLSAFLVYYFVVARYVGKRAGMTMPVLTDSLIGMLSEMMIATLAAVLTAFYATARVSLSQGEEFLSPLGYNILIFLLWVYATHLMTILVAGNVAGLVGWYLLEKARVRLPAVKE